jgi:hypothetical protein
MKAQLDTLPDRLAKEGIRFQSEDWGELNVSHVHLPRGADTGPLLAGLPDDLCPVPHWGMVLQGSVTVTYKDGASETLSAGDVYHWPAGHAVIADEDFRSIEFSPKESMRELIAHLRQKLGA